MTDYTKRIMQLERTYEQSAQIKRTISELTERLAKQNRDYAVMLEAKQILASVSDENTRIVLDYITGVVNRILGELFPYDARRVYLERKLYRGQYAHINMQLVGANGKVRDMQLQSGTGIRQVVSVLFILSTIEIRKGRRLFLSDELLSGLHSEAKKVVMGLLELFAEGGYQFIMVEYGANNGKIYMVEHPSAVSTVTALSKGQEYNNEVFIFNRPPEKVDLSIQVD